MDRYEIVQDSTAAYYQAVKRKLTYSFYEGYELHVRGKGLTSSHLLCHPFIGTYDVQNINDSTFQFTGKGHWPTTGLWEDGFSKYEYLYLELVITNQGWRITQLIFPNLDLLPNRSNIDSLRSVLDTRLELSVQGNFKSEDCFSDLERYEFALFAAVINGDTTRINEYLDLQHNYNLAYGGEFSEYYNGNIYYLLARELITPELLARKNMLSKHDWIRRVYGYWE